MSWFIYKSLPTCGVVLQVSELYVELYSDAPFVDARDVGVCQTPYIVDTQDPEDVFDTEGYLHVRGGGHIVLLLVAVREIE